MQNAVYKKYAGNPIPVPISIINLFTVYKLKWDSANNDSNEYHDFPELIYVESGEFNVRLDGKEDVTVLPGEVILYSPCTAHGPAEKKTAANIYVITFDTAEPISDEIFNKPILLSAKQRTLISDAFTAALRLTKRVSSDTKMRAMLFEQEGSRLTFQRVKCNLELLIIELCEAETKAQISVIASNSYNAKSDDFINVSEFLKKNITKQLSVRDIAGGCSLSVSKLKKIFLHDMSGGVTNYFNDLKIAEAKRLIRTSSMNFTQIAEYLSFGSMPYFSRVFKSKTGVSPSEYAKKIDKR